MTTIAVVAHSFKSLDGGLPELRRLLAIEGVTDPLWFEVSKSKKASKVARRALKEGADVLLIWGGDGMVQRVVDAVAGSGITIGVLPAGTANLFATNLGIPHDLTRALEVALHGVRRVLDVGVVNGERFAVMAGAGFDAAVIGAAGGKLKRRFGRLAYVWSGAKAIRHPAYDAAVDIDGKPWFRGRASCVLLASMGTLTGGLVAFPDASPSDGELEVGVVTAVGPFQWIRLLSRLVNGSVPRSPFTRTSRGRKVDVRFAQPVRYEVDGGVRSKERRLEAHVEPAALIVCQPAEGQR
jgi:diacylglycerol kinase family enzyme